MRIFKKLFGNRREKRVESNWNPFTFPGNIMHPESVTAYASPTVSGAWSAIYITRALQESYTEVPVHLVIRSDFAGLASFLPWKPELHTWESSDTSLEPELPENTLLFATEPDDTLLRIVEKNSFSACISNTPHPAVNIHVRTENEPFPGSIEPMMKVLGLGSPGDWVPGSPAVLTEKASAILSPVSHRTLPYILSTEAAAALLEKKRAEVPLKLVITDGKSSNIPPETDCSLTAAIVAGASAVVTTEKDLWLHASALRIPVIALDRKGTFTGWDRKPATGDTQFLEDWAALIRQGW